MFKLAIVGGRDFKDYPLLKSKVDEVAAKYGNLEIVSGGAEGADSLGAFYAKDNGLKLTVFYPNWKKLGKSAGPARNRLIVKECDGLLAFWDGKSRGTRSTINIVEETGKPYTVINY